MFAVGTLSLVRLAVRTPTGRTRARVLCARRSSVDVTRGQPVVAAELLGANRAREPARATGDVVFLAHDELRSGTRTGRTRPGPRAPPAQSPLTDEAPAAPLRRRDHPLGALDEELSLHDLER